MDNGDPERIKNNKECRNSKKVMPKKKKKDAPQLWKNIFSIIEKLKRYMTFHAQLVGKFPIYP